MFKMEIKMIRKWNNANDFCTNQCTDVDAAKNR